MELDSLHEELGKIIECKNGTIATLASIRDKLKEENKELKEKLDFEKTVKVNSMREASKYAMMCGAYNEFIRVLEDALIDLKEELKDIEE